MSLENVNSQKSVQDAQAPAKSTKAEASATLLKRGSMQRPSENTLRSLDLALPVSSPKDKVRVTTDFVYNINTIELSQLDSTRTKGLRQFSPISSLNRPPESGTPEQRAVVRTQVNNLLNTITKKTVELPKGVITKEQQIGTVFNENIKGVLTGLKTINTESARNTLKALTHGGKILDASGIQDLLRSSGKADQKKGMEALKALSNLCKDSQLLSTAVRKSTAFSSNVSGNTLDPIQVQT